jgi:hypothetical protein
MQSKISGSPERDRERHHLVDAKRGGRYVDDVIDCDESPADADAAIRAESIC